MTIEENRMKSETPQTRLLWVFGTLMSEMGANHILGKNAKLKCVGYIDNFDMYVAGYPRLLENLTTGCKILGEVWEIPEENFAQINRYEGVPSLFDLVKVDFFKHPGERSIMEIVGEYRDLWMYQYQWHPSAELTYVRTGEFSRIEPNLGEVVSFKHIPYFQGLKPQGK